MVPIDVVGGLCFLNGRMLLTQRLDTKDFPFAWECPGGKVEVGETHQQALAREWEEELGIRILGRLPERPIFSQTFDSPVGRLDRAVVKWSLYFVPPTYEGLPKPLEALGIGWFRCIEAAHLNLTPGNSAARQTIVRALDDVYQCNMHRLGYDR